ncbi:MAG: hypothetical protein U0798_16995 [Gemmataceae bacterium]
MSGFDVSRYGPAIAAILGDGNRLMPLDMGTPLVELRPALERFDPLRDIAKVVNAEAARACHAGLWLYANFFDESHEISQDIHSPLGSAWHAILHRREPDAGNSQYWWRRVGRLPIFEPLQLAAKERGYSYTTPEAFVNYCERVRGSGSTDEDTAKLVQLCEWQLLFDYCFSLSIGSGNQIRL